MMKFHVFAAALLVAPLASAETVFLATGTGVDSGNPAPETLYQVDTDSCDVTTVGAIGDSITSMDFGPSGDLLGIRATSFNDPPYTLYQLDLASGAGTAVVDLNDGAGGENVGNFPDMTFDPVSGNWYAWTENSDDLTQFDPATGVVTVTGDSTLSSAGSGTSADSNGVIWHIPCSGCGDGIRSQRNATVEGGGSADELYTINPADGSATFVVQLTGENTSSTINGMDFGPDDTLWAIEGGFCFDVDCPTRLVTVDTATGAITEVCPTGSMPTGVDAIAVAGVFSAVSVPLMNSWMLAAIALLIASIAGFAVWRRAA